MPSFVSSPVTRCVNGVETSDSAAWDLVIYTVTQLVRAFEHRPSEISLRTLYTL